MPSAKELLKGLRLFLLFFFLFFFSSSFPFCPALDCLGCCIYDVGLLLFNAVTQCPLNKRYKGVLCSPPPSVSPIPVLVTQQARSRGGLLELPRRFL